MGQFSRLGMDWAFTGSVKNNSKKLRIGFVPLVDCAPIALAQELGLFKKRGLNVDLRREPGWASIRDKMAYGELEAAHAPVGLCFALSWGLGVLRKPCVTGYLINSNGDAITVSKELSEAGVSNAESLASEIKTKQRDRPLCFGVPHLFSTHHFLLLQWLRPFGIVPGPDIQIMVLPPSLMASCLASGNIDGYCVGEPFNSLAVEEGAGVILAESANLSPMHPEKALIVSESFERDNHEIHLLMIQAIKEAAILCETVDGRKRAAKILSSPEYLGITSNLIESSLFCAKGKSKVEFTNENFHVFHHPDVNCPDSEKANWTINQMRLAGLLDEIDGRKLPRPGAIFRKDIYEEAIDQTVIRAIA